MSQGGAQREIGCQGWMDCLKKEIMVFNAQAGPFVEWVNINPTGLCSVPLWAILSTP